MSVVIIQHTELTSNRDVFVYDDGEVTSIDGSAIPQAQVNYWDDGSIEVDIPGNGEISFESGIRGQSFVNLKASQRANVNARGIR